METLKSFSAEEFDTIKIIRSEKGQRRKLVDYLQKKGMSRISSYRKNFILYEIFLN